MTTAAPTLDPKQKQLITAWQKKIALLTITLRLLVGLSFLALVGATVDGELHNNDSSWHTMWAWCAGFVVLAWLIRFALRSIIRDKLWSALTPNAGPASSPKTLQEARNPNPKVLLNNQSVVLADASAYDTNHAQTLILNKTQVTTAELTATYTITPAIFNVFMRGSLDLSLKLRLFAFQTPHYMPHVFITSRKRSPYGLSSRNLSLIDEKLPRKLKFPDLEGDFSRFFDIYAADKAAIDILRILSPDVMIGLRDNGVNFDLELIDNSLYVYLEPSLSSPEQLEVVLRQITQLVDMFSSELARSTFYKASTGSHIRINRGAFYSRTIVARFSLVAGGGLAYVMLAVILGEAIASLYTGEFKVF